MNVESPLELELGIVEARVEELGVLESLKDRVIDNEVLAHRVIHVGPPL